MYLDSDAAICTCCQACVEPVYYFFGDPYCHECYETAATRKLYNVYGPTKKDIQDEEDRTAPRIIRTSDC